MLCRLGLAYAGSNREDVITLILPVLSDSRVSMEVSYIILPCLSVFLCKHCVMCKNYNLKMYIKGN